MWETAARQSRVLFYGEGIQVVGYECPGTDYWWVPSIQQSLCLGSGIYETRNAALLAEYMRLTTEMNRCYLAIRRIKTLLERSETPPPEQS